MNNKQRSREEWASLGRYARPHLRAMYRTMRRYGGMSETLARCYVAWTLDVVRYVEAGRGESLA